MYSQSYFIRHLSFPGQENPGVSLHPSPSSLNVNVTQFGNRAGQNSAWNAQNPSRALSSPSCDGYFSPLDTVIKLPFCNEEGLSQED